ncbi:SMAD/FHA domain-containing protein [Mycotypha africana]|uniref:SMAD/FHA domain-containing protein n=1 Tax=Mycotypha africana TaxID=64632 RepID=UPI0023018620|nr:SMAD/FHA domain-containing protein [Mycotypha africana]KAI8987731.1 SMAD/FHA domain-containing protein [Mycotypha africana]
MPVKRTKELTSQQNSDNNNTRKEAVPPHIPKLPYEKPSWSAKPTFNYSLEVLKNGASIETIKGSENKEFVTIGRLPICDILMEHPSISRYHAVIQFDRDGEAYLYDMGSAHGTKINKQEIPKREYRPLKPGDQIRFGESTRIYIFDSGKPYDPEQEALERREKMLKERIARATRGEPMSGTKNSIEDHVKNNDEEDDGVSWGFGEDAVEEEEDEEENNNPESSKKYLEEALNISSTSGDADLLSITDKALTYDDLLQQQNETEAKLKVVEKKLEEKRLREQEEASQAKDEDEDLDAYMKNLSRKPLEDDKSIFSLQKELAQLKKVKYSTWMRLVVIGVRSGLTSFFHSVLRITNVL